MLAVEQAKLQMKENFGFDRRNKKHLQMLKDVLSQYGTKRWQAAAKLYLHLNPVSWIEDPETGQALPTVDARTVNAIIVKENEQIRRQLDWAGNQYGKGRETDNRWGLRMPPGVLEFIELIDPDVLSGSPDERRKSLHDLMAAFPQYKILKKV